MGYGQPVSDTASACNDGFTFLCD